MRRASQFAVALPTLAILTAIANGQGLKTTYVPLGRWTDPTIEAIDQWEYARQARSIRLNGARNDSRPVLPGLLSKNSEILLDALLRKHPKLLHDSPEMAKQLLLRLYADHLPQLHGIMAEALCVDRNPEWFYVKKPNASQHDVYQWVNGRKTPFNGQVKFHSLGDPAVYVHDMIKDHRAQRFFIPDDHVGATKQYLKLKAERLTATGDASGANAGWRNYGRLHPLGATSAEIKAATTQAAREIARALAREPARKPAAYVSLGATLALSLGSTSWDWLTGDTPSNVAAYRAARAMSPVAVGVGTEILLQQGWKGALRGTVRGNLIVGGAVTITEVVWLLHEHGSKRAFYQPQFYEQVGGGVTAFGLGTAGFMGGTALAVETGPWAPVIGTATGFLAGTVGYFGGRSATHLILQVLSPEMLRQQEQQKISEVKERIALDLKAAQTWPAR